MIRRCAPRIFVIRHRLEDGFSDHILSQLAASGRTGSSRCVVLLEAGSPSAVEANQIALGAEVVLRDPLRPDVLLAYLEKYLHAAAGPSDTSPTAPAPRPFAGGLLHSIERRLQLGERFASLTPREAELLEMLLRDAGQLVSYDTLYSEILNRPFAGESANMRVLLDLSCRTAASIGIKLRDWIEVIPKTGYRYHPQGRPPAPPLSPRSKSSQPAAGSDRLFRTARSSSRRAAGPG